MISQFLIVNSKNGVVNHGKVAEAAASFGVCRRTIQNTWAAAKKQMLEGGPVSFKSKKKGTCNRAQLQLDVDKMKSIPFSQRTTIRRLASELKVSKSSVGRWIKQRKIKPHTNAIKPTITEANQLQRLNYSLRSLHLDRESNKIKYETMHNVIHIDEKWFFLTIASMRCYKVDDDPYRTCKNKRFIPKVMFICAVARPLYGNDGEVIFDGKIGIFPFIKTAPAQRNIINRLRGTMVTKPIDSITKEITKDVMMNQIIPAIKAKWPESASKHIIIQQDNAKPHLSNNDPDFRAVASSDGFDIQIIFQPPNSPDTNVLDLGYFNSIQTLQVDTPSETVEELQSMIEVMKIKGHNKYKTPHMGKEALRRTNTLPLSLEVPEDVVREGIEHLITHGYHGGASYDIGSLKLRFRVCLSRV